MQPRAVRRHLVWLSALLLASPAAADPTCDGPDNFAAGMVFAKLKNAGLLDNAQVDFARTAVTRLASQKIGKDLYRQVHRVVYVKRSGEAVEAIAVNDASSEECSMSDVEVSVVSRRFPAK